jgi:hypothetical protein
MQRQLPALMLPIGHAAQDLEQQQNRTCFLGHQGLPDHRARNNPRTEIRIFDL